MNPDNERAVLRKLTEALSDPSQSVSPSKLRAVSSTLDNIPLSTKAPPIQPPDNIRLNNEWYSDDWDRVAAFAITRMVYGQLTKLVEEVFDKGIEFDGGEPPDPEFKLRQLKIWEKAWHQWAKEKLNK